MKTTKQTYNAKRYLLIILVTLIFVASLIYILASPTASASAAEIPTQYQYTITYTSGTWSLSTGNSLKYSVRNGNSTAIATEQYLQTCIEAIRVDTANNDCIIIFDLGDSLDSTTCTVTLNGSWGNVTLQGRLSSKVSSESTPTFGLLSIDGVSVISEATIQNTCNTNTKGIAVYLKNGGSLLVNSGTITSGMGKAIYNNSTGTVNITGGTVSSKVTNNSTGLIIVGNDVINSIGTYSLYPVTFEPNGGTITGGNATQSVVEGGSAVAPTVTRTDYTLTGWDKDYTNITAKVTTTAQWTASTLYTVTYKDYEGSILYQSESNDSGVQVKHYDYYYSLPEGYGFVGWKRSDTNSMVYPGDVFYISSSITLTACVEYVKDKKYSFTFNLNGGTLVSGELTQLIPYGERCTDPIIERPGYIFDKWSISNEFSYYMFAVSNCTLTANWLTDNNEYSVTFDLNGGTRTGGGLLNQLIKSGNSAVVPVAERKDYTLIGWSGNWQSITSNCTITAQWTYSGPAAHTVTFDLNGGSRYAGGELIQSVEHGKSAVLPSVERPGYKYIGWTGSWNNVTSDCTIVAQWEKITTYTVTFDLNGGTLVSGELSQSVVPNQWAFAPVFTRDGYTFTGWTGTPSGIALNNITADCTFTAQWEKIIKYTVTFDLSGGIKAGGGSLVQSVEYGHTGLYLTVPIATREGYTFDCWVNKSNDVKFNNITADCTFTAQWGCEIVFDLASGTHVGGGALSQFVICGESAVLPTTTRSGYIFSGWKGNYLNITAPCTITAQWTVIPENTISFVNIKNNINDEVITLPVDVDGYITSFTSFNNLKIPISEFNKLLPVLDHGNEITVAWNIIFNKNTGKVNVNSFLLMAYSSGTPKMINKNIFSFSSIPNTQKISYINTNLDFYVSFTTPLWSSNLVVDLMKFRVPSDDESTYEILVNYDTTVVDDHVKDDPETENIFTIIGNWFKGLFVKKEFKFWPWQWDENTYWVSYVAFIASALAVFGIALVFIIWGRKK